MPSQPATLHLRFGEAHEDLLSHHQVFAEHLFELWSGRASLYVIGASSIVLVETAGFRLAEMIACGNTRGGFRPFCDAGLSLQSGSEGRVSHQSVHLRYSGEVRASRLSSPTPSEGNREGSERVSFRFPSARQPLTEIEASEVEPGRLVVRTVHEYPEYGVLVLSHSRWEFA
jgi:hypothetical protein